MRANSVHLRGMLGAVIVALSACAPPGPVASPTSQPLAATPAPASATPPPTLATPSVPLTPPPPSAEPTQEFPADAEASATPALPFTLTSTAFPTGSEIPEAYTCFGANRSPALAWSGVPAGTHSLALIVYDPDSRPPGFVHWVVYAIDPQAGGLPEGIAPLPTLPDGARQGRNDFAPFGAGTFPGGAAINGLGYDGPCPPNLHRYVFTLYALDTTPALGPEATAAELTAAIEGHILGQAELVGVYAPPE